MVVPKQALLELLAAAGAEATHNFGQQLGVDVGRRIVERMGTDVRQASIETFVDQLGGELALLGLGSLAVERWGRALVVVMQQASAGKTGIALIAAVVSGALQRALSRDVAVVELAQAGDPLRLLIISKAAASQVRQWLSESVAWGDVLTRLHEQRGKA